MDVVGLYQRPGKAKPRVSRLQQAAARIKAAQPAWNFLWEQPVPAPALIPALEPSVPAAFAWLLEVKSAAATRAAKWRENQSAAYKKNEASRKREERRH